MNFNSGLHHRRSTRLADYDYSTGGGYFITIVTSRWKCLLGEVVSGEVRLSALGKIVREEWFKTAGLRPHVELWEDEFVVMPNHIHGIIWIIDIAGARQRRAPTTERFGKPVVGSIPTIVRAFKSAVTYRAHCELNYTHIWQRNYYEHIIRDQPDHERIAGYIISNSMNWESDEENPFRILN